MYNVRVICNSRLEYFDAVNRAKSRYKRDVYWTKQKEEELLEFGFPIYVLVQEDNCDWCIDKDCVDCGCHCGEELKTISYLDFMTKLRNSKLKRILKKC